jgi:hypothetical protein
MASTSVALVRVARLRVERDQPRRLVEVAQAGEERGDGLGVGRGEATEGLQRQKDDALVGVAEQRRDAGRQLRRHRRKREVIRQADLGERDQRLGHHLAIRPLDQAEQVREAGLRQAPPALRLVVLLVGEPDAAVLA